MPSMYRTILEADDVLTHQDPDNWDGAEDVKEIQDIVNDEDANAEEQEQGAEAAFGPDDGVEDIVDESMMFIAESEMAWQKIMHTIGMRELTEAAAGREALMEAADIKGWFKAAKDKIVAFFKKVWQVIQRWTGNVLAMVAPNKTFVKKYATQIKKGETLYAKADKKLKAYKFADFSVFNDKIAKMADAAKRLTDETVKDIKNGNGAFDENDDPVADSLNDVKKCFDGIGDVDMNDMGSFRDGVNKVLLGGEATETNAMTAAEIITVLEDKDNIKQTTKKVMDTAKKQFNAAMKAVSAVEKSIDSYYKDNKEAANKALAYATKWNTGLHKQLNLTQVARSAMLSAISKRIHQARRFGNYYVRLANKDAKPGFQKESAEYGFLGSLNLV